MRTIITNIKTKTYAYSKFNSGSTVIEIVEDVTKKLPSITQSQHEFATHAVTSWEMEFKTIKMLFNQGLNLSEISEKSGLSIEIITDFYNELSNQNG